VEEADGFAGGVLLSVAKGGVRGRRGQGRQAATATASATRKSSQQQDARRGDQRRAHRARVRTNHWSNRVCVPARSVCCALEEQGCAACAPAQSRNGLQRRRRSPQS
jgi:hypothetical protein